MLAANVVHLDFVQIRGVAHRRGPLADTPIQFRTLVRSVRKAYNTFRLPAICVSETPMNISDPIVLIVDDDHRIRESLQELLAAHGLRSQAFGSAGEYAVYERPRVPACLILDVHLPVIRRHFIPPLAVSGSMVKSSLNYGAARSAGSQRMCGRYAVTSSPAAIRALFRHDELPEFPPRYNIAPGQPIAIVRLFEGRRCFALVRWGLLPSWVKDPRGFTLQINARGESDIYVVRVGW